MPHATHPFSESIGLRRLESQPRVAAAAASILWPASRADDPATYLTTVLPAVSAIVGGDYAALAVAEAGRWTVTADAGAARSLPVELIGEAADRGAVAVAGPWLAAPLPRRDGGGEMLVVHSAAAIKPEAATAIEQLAAVLHEALSAVRARGHNHRRLRRLEAILEIASQWNQTHEVEPLLVEMAEAATRLLGADRASIFLWDRPNHTLVGRPALGIKNGELRIPDDRGVVGQVIQTGLPRRVDAAREPDQINRQVDAEMRYQTRTLLCVPLRGRSGELFGAFELINKLSGTFTQDDEDALVELAAHAAVALENAQDRQQLLLANRQDRRSGGRGRAADRQQPGYRRPALDHPPRGRHRSGRADPRRKRHRQGSRRASDSLRQPPPQSAVCGRELRGDPRDAGRERTVRPREGRVHRRPRGPRRQVRIGRRRHALSGRDRRLDARLPGQAAPRAGREGAGPRGRIDADPYRRARAGGHQSEPGRNGPREAVPRGSCTSA